MIETLPEDQAVVLLEEASCYVARLGLVIAAVMAAHQRLLPELCPGGRLLMRQGDTRRRVLLDQPRVLLTRDALPGCATFFACLSPVVKCRSSRRRTPHVAGRGFARRTRVAARADGPTH